MEILAVLPAGADGVIDEEGKGSDHELASFLGGAARDFGVLSEVPAFPSWPRNA